jgi:peptidoglycan L-alanyl-D-glutamate endopeptidase CwlK
VLTVTSYRVAKGDTLGKIARRFYGDAARFPLIVAANHIPDPDRLAVGQELVIPDLGAAAAGAAPDLTPPTGIRPSNPYAALNEQRLARLHPVLATRSRGLIDLAAHAGLAVLVTQGLRTFAEQDALYAQGRTAPGKIVTFAKAGQSYHNFGLAFDFVPLDALGKVDWNATHPAWGRIGELAESVGLEWGGRWTPKKRDLPHLQYTGGLSVSECLSRFRSAGIDEVWRSVH